MAELVRTKQVSSRELVRQHLEQIAKVNPSLNAAVCLLAESAENDAQLADRKLAAGDPVGPLHGVPFSVKDSIDVAGVRTTAGTWGRRHAPPAQTDATLVARLRSAGAIPIAKTNLPDLLFSFETDNLLFGRTNNPYDLARTPGGSSGGEAALIAACGSPLGLGSDCLGSVRVPAAFCGIASIKPTSGRLPRTGHQPPAGLWFEPLWQIGPMARHVEDLELAMQLLASPDGQDWTCPPATLLPAITPKRIAFFLDNGFAPSSPSVTKTIQQAAAALESRGIMVEERTPPAVAEAYELELALIGADGCAGIENYLEEIGSTEVHPLLTNFLSRMQGFEGDVATFARRWQQWDAYRASMLNFFAEFDAVLCPVYPGPALPHGGSMNLASFRGFSYTMAWSVAGFPAATVRCGHAADLPINLQVVAQPWHDTTALSVCKLLEESLGGWQPPLITA